MISTDTKYIPTPSRFDDIVMPQAVMIEPASDSYEDFEIMLQELSKTQSTVQTYRQGDIILSYTTHYQPDYHITGSLILCGQPYIVSSPLIQESNKITIKAYATEIDRVIDITLILDGEYVRSIEGASCE